MVIDIFGNKERYYPLHKDFKEGFDFIERSLIDKPGPGKYEIKGDEIFSLVQIYETMPPKENTWEAHRKYIDIQFILYGYEKIGWANIESASKDAMYDAERDFFNCGHVKDSLSCKMGNGYFTIFWPEDLHKPKCIWHQKTTVHKIIVKIALCGGLKIR